MTYHCVAAPPFSRLLACVGLSVWFCAASAQQVPPATVHRVALTGETRQFASGCALACLPGSLVVVRFGEDLREVLIGRVSLLGTAGGDRGQLPAVTAPAVRVGVRDVVLGTRGKGGTNHGMEDQDVCLFRDARLSADGEALYVLVATKPAALLLLRFDAITGNVLFTTELPPVAKDFWDGNAGILAVGESVLVGVDDGSLWSVDAITGDPGTPASLANDSSRAFEAEVLPVGRTICLSGDGIAAFARGADVSGTWRPKWSHEWGDYGLVGDNATPRRSLSGRRFLRSVGSPPVVACVAYDQEWEQPMGGTAYLVWLGPEDGSMVNERTALGKGLLDSSVVTCGQRVFCSVGNRLSCLLAPSGAIQWTRRFVKQEHGLVRAYAPLGRHLLVATERKVVCLRLDTGEPEGAIGDLPVLDQLHSSRLGSYVVGVPDKWGDSVFVFQPRTAGTGPP